MLVLLQVVVCFLLLALPWVGFLLFLRLASVCRGVESCRCCAARPVAVCAVCLRLLACCGGWPGLAGRCCRWRCSCRWVFEVFAARWWWRCPALGQVGACGFWVRLWAGGWCCCAGCCLVLPCGEWWCICGGFCRLGPGGGCGWLGPVGSALFGRAQRAPDGLGRAPSAGRADQAQPARASRMVEAAPAAIPKLYPTKRGRQ